MIVETESVQTIASHAALAGAGGTTAFLTIAAVAWRFYLKFREDRREDKHADAMDEARLGIVDELRSEIARLTARQEVLTTRVDEMAAERNRALVDNAKLEGELRAYQSRSEREILQLQVEIVEVRSELKKVETERDELRSEYQKLLIAQSDPHAPKRRSSDRIVADDDETRDVRKI